MSNDYTKKIEKIAEEMIRNVDRSLKRFISVLHAESVNGDYLMLLQKRNGLWLYINGEGHLIGSNDKKGSWFMFSESQIMSMFFHEIERGDLPLYFITSINALAEAFNMYRVNNLAKRKKGDEALLELEHSPMYQQGNALADAALGVYRSIEGLKAIIQDKDASDYTKKMARKKLQHLENAVTAIRV